MAGGTVLNSAMRPQATQPTSGPEANSNPQNTTTATYSNQSSPTNNLNVTFSPNFNIGDGSKSYNGNGGGGQQGSDLNSNTESSSENSAGLYGHGRMSRRFGGSLMSNGVVGLVTVVSLGAMAAYYALKPANPENILVSPHSWHNWKRSEISTAELAQMAPEQVGEMMAHDALFGMKRSTVGGSTQDAIPEIIKTIDQELQELKKSQKKTGWVQTLGLGWVFGVDPEIVTATKKAIERDEILLSQLSKWYAADLSLRTCGHRAELIG